MSASSSPRTSLRLLSTSARSAERSERPPRRRFHSPDACSSPNEPAFTVWMRRARGARADQLLKAAREAAAHAR
ncbi:hypothetical protein ACFPRL_16645 [Pseudoclavibacter helvolus]